MSRVLITGGAGFIGSHLTAACLAAGHETHLIIRPESDDQRLLPMAGRFVRHGFDLRSEEAVRRCMIDVQPEIVFHLAASPRRPERPWLTDATEAIKDDLLLLVHLLSAATSAPRQPNAFVRAGSLAEYGSLPPPYREESREAPRNVYGATLVAGGHFVKALQPRLLFPVSTARLALIYGPSQSEDYLIPALISRCLAGERTMIRHPDDRRDLIHVDDAVDGLMRMARLPLPPATIVNLASGAAPSMREVAGLVLQHTGADPSLVDYGDGFASSGTADLRGSPELAAHLLGWKARMPLSEGIARTVGWHRTQITEQTAEAAQ